MLNLDKPYNFSVFLADPSNPVLPVSLGLGVLGKTTTYYYYWKYWRILAIYRENAVL